MKRKTLDELRDEEDRWHARMLRAVCRYDKVRARRIRAERRLARQITGEGKGAAPYCVPCGDYHVVPRDGSHHKALACKAPVQAFNREGEKVAVTIPERDPFLDGILARDEARGHEVDPLAVDCTHCDVGAGAECLWKKPPGPTRFHRARLRAAVDAVRQAT